MKKIEAIIKPFKLEDVRNALRALEIDGMTVSDVHGYGRQKGHCEVNRGVEYETDFLPRIKLEIVLKASKVDAAIEAITQATRTGKVGDGKIFVMSVDRAIRIRTGEKDEEAL